MALRGVILGSHSNSEVHYLEEVKSPPYGESPYDKRETTQITVKGPKCMLSVSKKVLFLKQLEDQA